MLFQHIINIEIEVFYILSLVPGLEVSVYGTCIGHLSSD